MKRICVIETELGIYTVYTEKECGKLFGGYYIEDYGISIEDSLYWELMALREIQKQYNKMVFSIVKNHGE